AVRSQRRREEDRAMESPWRIAPPGQRALAAECRQGTAAPEDGAARRVMRSPHPGQTRGMRAANRAARRAIFCPPAPLPTVRPIDLPMQRKAPMTERLKALVTGGATGIRRSAVL